MSKLRKFLKQLEPSAEAYRDAIALAGLTNDITVVDYDAANGRVQVRVKMDVRDTSLYSQLSPFSLENNTKSKSYLVLSQKNLEQALINNAKKIIVEEPEKKELSLSPEQTLERKRKEIRNATKLAEIDKWLTLWRSRMVPSPHFTFSLRSENKGKLPKNVLSALESLEEPGLRTGATFSGVRTFKIPAEKADMLIAAIQQHISAPAQSVAEEPVENTPPPIVEMPHTIIHSIVRETDLMKALLPLKKRKIEPSYAAENCKLALQEISRQIPVPLESGLLYTFKLTPPDIKKKSNAVTLDLTFNCALPNRLRNDLLAITDKNRKIDMLTQAEDVAKAIERFVDNPIPPAPHGQEALEEAILKKMKKFPSVDESVAR